MAPNQERHPGDSKQPASQRATLSPGDSPKLGLILGSRCLRPGLRTHLRTTTPPPLYIGPVCPLRTPTSSCAAMGQAVRDDPGGPCRRAMGQTRSHPSPVRAAPLRAPRTSPRPCRRPMRQGRPGPCARTHRGVNLRPASLQQKDTQIPSSNSPLVPWASPLPPIIANHDAPPI